MMKDRPFGSTGVRVGEVGLGAWQIGGSWGEITDVTARQILEAAVESGTTFFDTADVYGGGRSESLIGAFLAESKAPVFLATKLGRGSDPGSEGSFSLSGFRRFVEGSLRRMRLDTLDLIQLHCIPTEQLRRGEVFDWLRELQREGKVRYFGASVESMDEAALCLQQDGLASLQIIFNLLRQKPIDVLFDEARARGVALIVRLPLASGLLSGKLTRSTRFASDDHRSFNRDGQMFNVGETFAGLPYETGLDLVDQLRPMVPAGMTMAQMALRWILDHEAVSVVIPGASSPEQARANAEASDLPPLDPALHSRLRDWYAGQVADKIRGPY